MRGCDLLIARNLEMLAIASRIAGGRPIVYECLDIHRTLLGTAIHHRLIQALHSWRAAADHVVARIRRRIFLTAAWLRRTSPAGREQAALAR
jgi:hypothetical protein